MIAIIMQYLLFGTFHHIDHLHFGRKPGWCVTQTRCDLEQIPKQKWQDEGKKSWYKEKWTWQRSCLLSLDFRCCKYSQYSFLDTALSHMSLCTMCKVMLSCKLCSEISGILNVPVPFRGLEGLDDVADLSLVCLLKLP